MTAKQFNLPLLRKEQLGENTYSFYFDRRESDWDFIPGQYVYMTLPHEYPDDRGTGRYFTIASSPKQKDMLMFTMKIFQSSFKEALLQLKPGEAVQMFGPMGWFLLPEHTAKEKVFISGGIGITPFHSLLQTVADESLLQPITLFASFANKEEILFHDVLQKVSKKNSKIRVVYTLTQEEWSGETGRVTPSLLQKHLVDILRPVYYIVGKPAMVASTQKMLVDSGVPEEQIQIEDFTGY